MWGWMGLGWDVMVSIDHRYSKSTFGANKLFIIHYSIFFQGGVLEDIWYGDHSDFPGYSDAQVYRYHDHHHIHHYRDYHLLL